MPKQYSSRSKRKRLDLEDVEGPTATKSDSEWEEQARGMLLNRLSRGPRSKAQLRLMLASREIPEHILEPLLSRFEDVGLIDDAKFAEAFTRSRRESRGLARRALAQELKAVGIEPQLVDEALEPIDSEADLQLAVELVRRKWSSLAYLNWEVRRRRLYGQLGRRGFGGNTIATAIALVESEQPAS